MEREGGWNLLCKFFDNLGPIPHHMHQSDEQAQAVGRREAGGYYFPPQYNQIDNNFPYTFMGLEPGTTKDDVRRCLETGTRATTASYCRGLPAAARHRLADRPGILHAPGSLVTCRSDSDSVRHDSQAAPEARQGLPRPSREAREQRGKEVGPHAHK